jgi:surfeit locus 1 family protein
VNYRTGAFVALAVLSAAVFVRLGFWQLDRHAQRKSFNADRAARLALGPAPFDSVRRLREGWLRQATLEGQPDSAREFLITGRSRHGSPGVYIMTPLRMSGNDTAVLVNRGWVYAPDAATADLNRWRESRTSFSGHTDTLPTPPTAPQLKGRGLRSLSMAGVDSLLPYPFHSLYLVAHDSVPDSPARLSQPVLDAGSHLSYAIQWFCFAAIAIGGAVIVWHKARRA